MTKVTPLKVKDLSAFIAAITPILDLIQAGDFKGIIINHSANLIDAVVIGAKVEREWLEGQDIDVLLDLATQVIEANTDFFIQKLLPKLLATLDNSTDVLTKLSPNPLPS